ncbi:hypothetical protein ACLOJK_026055 [Asimina triloba]
MKQHSLDSGFSCAKGYLLERKPEHAAAIVHLLYQTLPHKKRPQIGAGLRRLGNEWFLNVINRKKDGKQYDSPHPTLIGISQISKENGSHILDQEKVLIQRYLLRAGQVSEDRHQYNAELAFEDGLGRFD